MNVGERISIRGNIGELPIVEERHVGIEVVTESRIYKETRAV